MELLKIRTDQFEGPLDLLLFLIQKNEMDIASINIHKITDQYVQYIELMKELNFDVASDFLVMAATLIHLKSKKLLPGDETVAANANAEDNVIQSEEELIRRLLEYKKFQEASKRIISLPVLNQDVFSRPNVLPPDKQTIWKELDITNLTLAFQTVLRQNRRRSKVIIREALSIPEKISQLGQIFRLNEMTEFASLMSPDPDKTEIVVTFITLLELARLKKIKVYQNQVFGSIHICLVSPITDADSALANGFQYNVRRIEELVVHA